MRRKPFSKLRFVVVIQCIGNRRKALIYLLLATLENRVNVCRVENFKSLLVTECVISCWFNTIYENSNMVTVVFVIS